MVDRTSGIVLHVFHDSVSAPLAVRTIPTLAAMYKDLARMAGVDAGQVNWFGVAFIRDTLDPRLRAGDASLWPIHVDATGALSQSGVGHLFLLVPHEQTHAIQRFPRPDLPRWFTEGHAEWQALRSAERFRPAVAEARRAELARARVAVAQPPRLEAWRAIVRIKPSFPAASYPRAARAHGARSCLYAARSVPLPVR